MNTSIDTLEELKLLLQKSTVATNEKVLVGFDGFVDWIKKAVRQRRPSECIYFNTMTEFADRIKNASGRSGQIELITQRIKLGGNGPILSDSLGMLGIHSYCLGSMGYPNLNPLFADLKNCEPISILAPGESVAVEFNDGKIILSDLGVFDQYDWKYIRESIGLPEIKRIIEECRLIALVDWVNLPHSSDIWEGLLQDVIKPSGRNDFIFFFDLCDPSKKTTQQIDEILDLISCFSSYGKVTLGLNETEVLKIWSSLNGCFATKDHPSIREAGDYVYKMMNIDCILIHPVVRSLAFHKREFFEMNGRFVTQPKVLTGGGDNFNAGFCLGSLLGFELPHCMLLGMAASGFYVENGVSPTKADILHYIDVWMADLAKEISSPVNLKVS